MVDNEISGHAFVEIIFADAILLTAYITFEIDGCI